MANVPGLGAAQAAGAFGGIKDAISMYMKLRDKRSDDERQARQDQLGRDRFGLEQQNFQLDQKKADASMKEQRYKTIADVLDNYGGQAIGGGFANEVMQSPYAAALTPHHGMSTLPSDTMGTIQQHNPGAPGPVEPGMYDVIPSASEKYRSAMAGITARTGMNAATNASHEAVAQLNAHQRAQQFAASQGVRWAALNQQQRLAMIRLTQQQEYQQALIDDRNIDNQYRFENPTGNSSQALMDALGVGGAAGGGRKRTAPPPISLGSDWEQVK